MWIFITKKLAKASSQIVRQVSNFADDLGEGLIEAKKIFINDQEKKNTNKSLKIAILGLPNVGKSTLINHLVGRPVCAASKKIHTTRYKAAAICSVDDTQLIFLDTPGLVERGDMKRYKLGDSFKTDVQNSMQEADVIGLVQDMTRLRCRESIAPNILKLISMAPKEIDKVLILNKIDTMKNKKHLLTVVKQLSTSEGYPNFSDIFMISALTGDGVKDLRNYFLDTAKERNWEYDKTKISDQKPNDIIEQIVKSKLLDNLSRELPYKVKVILEHLDYHPDSSIDVAVKVECPSNRIARLVIGLRGERIKQLALESEQELCKVFQTAVKLKIEIPINTKDYQKQLKEQIKA